MAQVVDIFDSDHGLLSHKHQCIIWTNIYSWHLDAYVELE